MLFCTTSGCSGCCDIYSSFPKKLSRALLLHNFLCVSTVYSAGKRGARSDPRLLSRACRTDSLRVQVPSWRVSKRFFLNLLVKSTSSPHTG